jgi:endoglucanase
MTPHARLMVASVLPLVFCTTLFAADASQDTPGFLKADGHVLRDNHGRGKPIRLHGVNLGGWLEWQEWMCPIDSSKTLRDANPGHNGYDFEVRKLLVQRFGPQVAADLISTYESAWITEPDLDNIQGLGMNVVRLTLAYDTLLQDDGSWRPDAFTRADWLVTSAWKRGIYTIIDLHAFLPPAANQDGSAAGYWSSQSQKQETVKIWNHIAAHYKANPAVAFYDLLNEPNNSQLKGQPSPKSATVCDIYEQLYRSIRLADPDHAIAMEGTWDWHSLRDPAKSGFRNVIYSFHWYHFGVKTTADFNAGTDRDLQSLTQMQQKWNVPAYIGEFNLFGDADAWKYALAQYDEHGLSWTMWTYKNKASGTNSWGVYTTIPGKAPPVPNLATDSADEIKAKWQAWATTPETFAKNPMLEPLLQAEVPSQAAVVPGKK